LPVIPFQIGRKNRITGANFCGLKDTEKGYKKSAEKTNIIFLFFSEKAQLVVDIGPQLR